MINVLADKHLVNIANFFPPEVNLHLFDSASSLPNIPDDTHALLIRTVTKINAQTFPNFPKNLSFIGTGSAGTDHVDISYVKNNGITFADAAGCNARSVAEYVGVVLLLWAEKRNIDLKEETIGIIGVGHTGGEVEKLLQAMGIKTIGYDPPRQERDADFESASLHEVLQSSILTFHTPLTKGGGHPTYHWFDADKAHNNTFKLIINAARGSIVDEKILLKAYQENQIEDFILDVWEDEPDFDDSMARQAFIKTPHIAGYSIQAKNNASKLIAHALLNHFSISTSVDNPTFRPDNVDVSSCPSSIYDVLTCLHPVLDYQQKLIRLIGLPSEKKKTRFNHIRSSHPLRYELQSMNLNKDIINSFPILTPLFKV